MTSSFGISPQRQIRDLVAQPERPTAPARPAEPSAIPQQLGGQLMYSASFQKNTEAEQAVKNIESFLAENGVFDQTQKILFESYKAEKKQQAQRILASEATAYRDSLDNANETEQLKKKGDLELARQNQLSNPWVNYFYYDTKATNAGREVAVNLAAWGKQSAERLAELPDDQRAAAMAEKAQRLMKPYADVPEAFRAAKIDPLVSATLFDLKKDVVNKSYERTVQIDQQTALAKFNGGLKLSAALIKGSLGAKEGVVLAQQGVQQSVNDFYSYYVDVRGYSEKEATELLFREAGQLFIDVDGNNYNDIGEAFGFANMAASFANIKTRDGQNVLDLRNAKGQTFKQVLEAGAQQAVKRSEAFFAAEERQITRVQRDWRRNIAAGAQDFYTQFPDPTDDQIVSQRKSLKNLIRQQAAQGLLPEGLSPADADEIVDKAYPYQNKDISPEQASLLELEAKELIADGKTQMPAEFRERAEGTKAFGSLVKLFGEAEVRQKSVGYKEAEKTLVKGLVEGLKGSFMQDPAIKAITMEKGERPKQKKALLNQAILEAKPRLQAEASTYFRRKLNEAAVRGENVSDPNVQLRILEEGKKTFFQRPEFSDVDTYYNITDPGAKFGQKITIGPAIGSSTKDASGRWIININDSDNRASWAATAAPVFANNPKAGREYLSSRYVFNQTELGEINAALSTGDLSKLSQSTRRSIANVQKGFGNKLTTAEILQKQAGLYFDGVMPPVFRENAFKIDKATRVAVAGGGTRPVDASIVITPGNHEHSRRPGGSGNNAVDFTIVRQSNQTSNPVPAPFSGTIVSARREGGFGLTMVIRADADGPGYNKGDLVRLAHLAALYYSPGQRIRRGMPIGKSGDSSPHDSRPGYSGTGAGDPGHVHIQLYRPGGADQRYQYGQETQNSFVRKSYLPLFRRSS